jgi:alkanesulfonate monooxygenase SsuD/methylene tetrahydromethanopterin reductase-like flavin-dependent oxidoreductase (luciferase family)
MPAVLGEFAQHVEVHPAQREAAGELSVLDSSLTLAVAAAVTSSITVGCAIYVPALDTTARHASAAPAAAEPCLAGA